MCIMYILFVVRISLLKLRCANSRLPIYKHVYIIDDSDVCILCNLNVCGNEYHCFNTATEVVEHGLQCDKCESWIHYVCTNLPP